MKGKSICTLCNGEKFLGELRDGKSVTAACKAAGISRSAAYDWRNDDAAFGKTWDEALEAGTDRLEDEAHRRAVEGVERPVFQQGRQVGSVREYSDTLLLALLKARRPERFKDRATFEHSGKMTLEELVRLSMEPPKKGGSKCRKLRQ